MAELAAAEGFPTPTMLLGPDATSDAVNGTLAKQATRLVAGDLLLVTYSGHGSFRPDHGSDDEDGFDETFVLYDRQLLDDELWLAWSKFEQGVRILFVCDSCHSGTVARRVAVEAALDRVAEPPVDVAAPPARRGRVRRLPPEARRRDFEARRGVYGAVARRTPSPDDVDVTATVLLFAACQDDEEAIEDEDGGVFTKALIGAWKTVSIRNYGELFDAIVDRVSGQSPNYLTLGREDPAFEQQRPFTS